MRRELLPNMGLHFQWQFNRINAQQIHPSQNKREYIGLKLSGRHHPATHRAIGRVIVIAGCVSAASGLWMTHTYVFPEDLQGNLLYWVRMVLGSLMI
ncbi:MAG: hypothetical protein COB04_18700, partial [Gammaproteobacteria bacterium]